MLDSFTEFFRAHLNDSLEEVAPEMRVFPGFISLDRAFDKKFSFCENYHNGPGEVFHPWMMDNHSDELLFCVERAASDRRQDVASMDAMEIFCNRNTVLSS